MYVSDVPLVETSNLSVNLQLRNLCLQQNVIYRNKYRNNFVDACTCKIMIFLCLKIISCIINNLFYIIFLLNCILS